MRSGGLLAAALVLAGCGVLTFGGVAPPPAQDPQPKGPPVASGVTNGVPWTMHAWTEVRADGGFTCTSFETAGGSGGSGCGNGGVGPRDLGLARQVGDRLISRTGLVGSEIVKVRVHYGDGSVTEHLTLPSPVSGTRVAAIVLRAAPVPTSLDGLGANAEILVTEDL